MCKKTCLLGIVLLALSKWAFSDMAWTASSSNGSFDVRLVPQAGEIVVGDYSKWNLFLKDVKDRAISKAQISISAGMFGEGHGHGMPASPRVTKEISPGNYLVEGMFFNMFGMWTVFIDVSTPQLRGQARLDLMADVPELAP